MSAPRPLAIVTGAARGIGAGVARELGNAGFDLALIDRSTDGIDELLSALSAGGATARAYRLDLAEVESHAAVIEQIVAAQGPIRCLVNNAGVPAMQRGDLLDMRLESFDQVLGVNLRGTFFLTQAVARHMVGQGGEAAGKARSIVTVSSVSAELASVERGEYCISKAGLGMLTKLFALRLAEHGIGVFEIRPGIIRTPMTQGVAGRYDALIADGLVPMKRWGEPSDIGHAVAALAAGRMAFATGSVLNLDGALSVPRL